MTIPKRHASPNNMKEGWRTFFVTTSTFGKRRLLQSERMARLLIEVFYQYRAQGKFLLHDFVIMPDHVHLLISVNGDLSIEKAVQFIKGGFSFRAGKEFGIKTGVWQRGFSEARVYSEEAFQARRRYIHQNPVDAGLAVAAAEYPYSSAHPGFALDGAPDFSG